MVFKLEEQKEKPDAIDFMVRWLNCCIVQLDSHSQFIPANCFLSKIMDKQGIDQSDGNETG
jgi:hypothetical protein